MTCLVVTVKSRPTVWFRQSSNLQTVRPDKRAFAGPWLGDRQHRDGFVLRLNVGDTPCLVARQTVRSLWSAQGILFNQVVSFTAVMSNRIRTAAKESPRTLWRTRKNLQFRSLFFFSPAKHEQHILKAICFLPVTESTPWERKRASLERLAIAYWVFISKSVYSSSAWLVKLAVPRRPCQGSCYK